MREEGLVPLGESPPRFEYLTGYFWVAAAFTSLFSIEAQKNGYQSSGRLFPACQYRGVPLTLMPAVPAVSLD